MIITQEYIVWLSSVKDKIRSAQLKAAVSVNTALIAFYWELGKMIAEKKTAWGSKFLANLSNDLRQEFPDMKGFSVSNLKYCEQFFTFYNSDFEPGVLIGQQAVDQLQGPDNKQITFSQQLVGQIPWGHNILIFTRCNNVEEALFYAQQTLENNWSRDVLDLQLKSDLYGRKGKAVSNFSNTLPEPLSDLAVQTLKDPYVFDFLQLTEQYQERDIEKQLIQHISKFLLELGKGFAFIGNQYHLQIADNDYYIDLLFYHVKLKCYVVIELKNTRFVPEFAGKLNFYLSAVDSLVKDESDNPTIGILLCKDKNNIEAEFALRDMKKPMGISEIKFVENIPEDLKSSLPSIDELEEGLKNIPS